MEDKEKNLHSNSLNNKFKTFSTNWKYKNKENKLINEKNKYDSSLIKTKQELDSFDDDERRAYEQLEQTKKELQRKRELARLKIRKLEDKQKEVNTKIDLLNNEKTIATPEVIESNSIVLELEKSNKQISVENIRLKEKISKINIDDKLTELDKTRLDIYNVQLKINFEKETINNLLIENIHTDIEKNKEKIKTLLDEKKYLENKKLKLKIESINIIKDVNVSELVKEFEDIKNEINNENVKFYQVQDNKGEIRNVITTSFDTIIYWIAKKVFKKDIANKDYTLFTRKNIKIKTTVSIILAIVLSLIMLPIFKLVSVEKEHYGYSNDGYIIKQEKEETVTEEKNETETKIETVQRISADAMEEELSAQSSYKSAIYYFNVNRTITTKEKLHVFTSANWSTAEEIIPENTTLNVNFLTSPGGYMMYQIADGEYAGKFITANKNLVDVKSNDNLNETFFNKAIAIKIIANTNSYYDVELKNVKALVYQNVTLNISGVGVSDNNRLVYYLTDGTFVAVDPTKANEVQRTNSTTTNNTTTTRR